uniref:Uncharacterized protein n=1 Tax=Anguilla anguilla TaxID=7936 RepID=A0A0E9UA84_ANGAN
MLITGFLLFLFRILLVATLGLKSWPECRLGCQSI